MGMVCKNRRHWIDGKHCPFEWDEGVQKLRGGKCILRDEECRKKLQS